MSARKCTIVLRLVNGGSAFFRLRPLRPDELPNPFLCGFRLSRVFGADPYDDRRLGGSFAVRLAAAGLLPVALVALLRTRTELLDQAEARANELIAQADAADAAADAAEARAAALHARRGRKTKP